MKSYDFAACTYDGAAYCTEHLPDGRDENSDEVSPIFADSEWDFCPTCDHCGCVHDYVSLTTHGQGKQALEDALSTHRDGEYSEFVPTKAAELFA